MVRSASQAGFQCNYNEVEQFLTNQLSEFAKTGNASHWLDTTLLNSCHSSGLTACSKVAVDKAI